MAAQDSFGGYEQERFKDKVDIKLECGICLKVLKDPVQCPNEHYFCRSCIKTSLCETSEACPTCQHHLTEETLTKPPRFLRETLQDLIIRCNYENRGCQELIKLEFLDRHVQSCGYSPTRCSNAGCKEVINRHDKQRHELELCQFRKIDCDECGEQVIWKSSRVHPCFMRKEMDELTRRLNVVQNDMKVVQNDMNVVQNDMNVVQNDMKVVQNDMNVVQNDMNVVQNDMNVVQNDVKEVKGEVKLTHEEMAFLTKETTQRFDLFTGRRKIFVCGGRDSKTTFKSVESYRWPENSWTLESPMNETRLSLSAFVHCHDIYVSGGQNVNNTDSIERLSFDNQDLEWIKSPVNMPIKCSGHKMVCYENSAILIGGRIDDDTSDDIYEIGLNPPEEIKLLTQMPEARCYHGCEIVDDQVIIAGGGTSTYLKDTKNTVYLYDINNNECKILPPLPFAVANMATVSYKGNVVLIGGVNVKGETLNTVAMYDIKTGQIKMLHCLNHKRAGSGAVIAGNVIIVMGGYNYQTETFLDSVECLDLNTVSVWRELSPMTTKRGHTTAVLKSVF